MHAPQAQVRAPGFMKYLCVSPRVSCQSEITMCMMSVSVPGICVMSDHACYLGPGHMVSESHCCHPAAPAVLLQAASLTIQCNRHLLNVSFQISILMRS